MGKNTQSVLYLVHLATSAKKNYSQIEKKPCHVFLALTNFTHIDGDKFTLITDHKALLSCSRNTRRFLNRHQENTEVGVNSAWIRIYNIILSNHTTDALSYLPVQYQ